MTNKILIFTKKFYFCLLYQFRQVIITITKNIEFYHKNFKGEVKSILVTTKIFIFLPSSKCFVHFVCCNFETTPDSTFYIKSAHTYILCIINTYAQRATCTPTNHPNSQRGNKMLDRKVYTQFEEKNTGILLVRFQRG